MGYDATSTRTSFHHAAMGGAPCLMFWMTGAVTAESTEATQSQVGSCPTVGGNRTCQGERAD